ncbi:MAG: haloalkane dehalogenase [Pelagibacterales bacterium]|nr:haloalkane dehalogenase [Pelagibacterales bacterium]PPR16440.1 MAG: Haloalkane dehalogenase [Alphaproteobacteria bacterium MarineAlpha9_Bin3]|tara:strand:+ start:2968 stop:3843 length:876 start_codon:yes stop_codon:yes gene_type:complete
MNVTEHSKSKILVNNKNMAYVEMGHGETMLFLHGNPTSSYLWRNIMPYFSNKKRCIAPDLIGMGDSEKLDTNDEGTYNYFEHQKWLNDFLELLNLGNKIILVLHDWGSALGFDWASKNIDRVAGIIYMEGIVCPLTWDNWDEKSAPLFQAFRSDAGENMIIEKNIFVERVLPGSVLRGLTEEEMEVYRRPFLKKEDRRPTLDWPNQIPIDNEPKDVVSVVDKYSKFLSKNNTPKLFINAEPGAILIGKQREFCRSWPNQSEFTVPGSHFIQEDSPDLIGEGILNWLNSEKL